MEKKLILDIAIKEELGGGYSVICTDLGVASQGETINEATANIKEAVELYLESAEELGIMDDVLEKLGLTRKDWKKKEITVPRILHTEIPVKVEA
jgi:predicted RNase H-like HicB family nuclease